MLGRKRKEKKTPKQTSPQRVGFVHDRGKELLGLKVFAFKSSEKEIFQKEHKAWQRNLLQTFVLLENSPLGLRCNSLESGFDLVGMHPLGSHRLWSPVSKWGRTTMKPKINSRELESFCSGVAANLEYWKTLIILQSYNDAWTLTTMNDKAEGGLSCSLWVREQKTMYLANEKMSNAAAGRTHTSDLQ